MTGKWRWGLWFIGNQGNKYFKFTAIPLPVSCCFPYTETSWEPKGTGAMLMKPTEVTGAEQEMGWREKHWIKPRWEEYEYANHTGRDTNGPIGHWRLGSIPPTIKAQSLKSDCLICLLQCLIIMWSWSSVHICKMGQWYIYTAKAGIKIKWEKNGKPQVVLGMG